ncbi:MAG: DNA polymerase IV [Candidatus Margulisbacteria bacterium]|nr:DNA polymerase IV [Candidatus Margulisiibacteriota bacterium]MBU1617077.1 DNA polymerase IV [Candidatus Margulisiibacteriota bacterium]MBU1867029.1 DNA polymerase IV [Candidatus Margulisiibacteriota bacterium]
MRTILHVDMNAYFASVEQACNPLLRGKPVAVGGGTGGKRTVVAACSYEAKARGVENAMPAWEAKKICPDLVMVGGDMNKYIYTSCEVMKILREYTPQVEVFSIDEAFMDMTGTADRFGGAVAVAKEIKRRIREKFHLTCNIGIGPNKLLAKLAGELKKPDALIILRAEDIPDKIASVKVGKLCGVGRKLEQYLAEMGINTCGELHRAAREELARRFGAACGEHLWQMGQGKDNSEVCAGAAETTAKSMGHSYTLPRLTTSLGEVKGYLLRLSEQVGRRLRLGKYRGNVVHVSLGFDQYQFWGKQKKVEEYLDDGYDIYKRAEKLIESEKGTWRKTRGFRFVGVTASGLLHEVDQVSLFADDERKKLLAKAVDALNDRWGEATVERAALLGFVLEEKSGMVAGANRRISGGGY